MRTVKTDTITQVFIDTIAEDTDERLKFVLTSLVKHLHDFARETSLTHDEWRKGLELLYNAGEISSRERNEFVLFSDVLGLSSLVDMINSPEGATPSSVLGPFHILGAPDLPVGGDLKADNEGDAVVVEGRVLTTNGEPIEGAMLEIWQTAENGLYSGQDEAQPEYNLRARMTTGKDGRYLFSTIRPAPYTVPDDGPVGELLHATGRHPWRPSHLHFIAKAHDYATLVTEVFPSDDPYLDEDAVFGVRDKLIMEYKEGKNTDDLPDDLAIKADIKEPFYTVDFDLVLSPR
ncbi:MAG: dioxygenase [Parvularculales bacterium]